MSENNRIQASNLTVTVNGKPLGIIKAQPESPEEQLNTIEVSIPVTLVDEDIEGYLFRLRLEERAKELIKRAGLND